MCIRDRSELDDEEQEALMGCSCATGSPFGQAAVIGVPLASVVGMADLEDGVNTVTAVSYTHLRILDEQQELLRMQDMLHRLQEREAA